MRDGNSFNHFINEFNYLYQQTKTVSPPPSLSPHHLLYPTALFPTMTSHPRTRARKDHGRSKLKTKCVGTQKIIKIAHLVGSSFREETGVRGIMSMVCWHAHTHHTHICSYAPLQLCSRNSSSIYEAHTHTRTQLITGQTSCTDMTHTEP